LPPRVARAWNEMRLPGYKHGFAMEGELPRNFKRIFGCFFVFLISLFGVASQAFTCFYLSSLDKFI
jgi:hypothetical protein